MPQLFLDPNFYGSLNTEATFAYLAPSPDTMRTAFGSAMTGQILPVSQAQPNMSYTLQFLAPALRCGPADETIVSDMLDVNVQMYIGIENRYHYISWVPPAASPATPASGTR